MKLIPSGVFGEDFKQSFHKSPQIANNAWKFHICEFWAKGLQLPSFQLTLTGSEVMLNHRRMIKLVKPRKEKKNNLDAFWMLTYEIL